jgi:hypothetical protein
VNFGIDLYSIFRTLKDRNIKNYWIIDKKNTLIITKYGLITEGVGRLRIGEFREQD